MGATPKVLSRLARTPREQVVLGACPNCGTARVVMPCANAFCEAWFMVCDCGDESETSYESGGRCHACRALPSEERAPWEDPRVRTPRTSRGTYRGPVRKHRTRAACTTPVRRAR